MGPRVLGEQSLCWLAPTDHLDRRRLSHPVLQAAQTDQNLDIDRAFFESKKLCFLDSNMFAYVLAAPASQLTAQTTFY